ncbi:cation:proton antiporter [Rhizosaccharibacter radicis]|uniref:Cation:proton antiporter n=1 Tax=Rhizosaccharibacter radicis TaxID=2782605 RepID=A0ABT1VT43_9PROT|nr:cation:proton antiporter [Acetobacteraceae bacterium KSS12]
MLLSLFCLLATSVLLVALSRRLGLGSILGYLVAGVLIGPAGLRLVTNVDTIAGVSEFGVLMLLFTIGLELRPQRLWVMRHAVLGLGVPQLLLAGGVLALLAHACGLDWTEAAVVGTGLALSSTAIVLPLLGERDLLGAPVGREAFALLLFQDVASIPLIAILPLLTGHAASAGSLGPAIGRAVLCLALILVGGRLVVQWLFRFAGNRNPELFTAIALLVVAAGGGLAELAHLPLSIGAFAAGVVLSESGYRHELKADIEPFEGLLLGFFFVSVGMSANLSLLWREPGIVLFGTALLLATKLLVTYGLGRLRGLNHVGSVRLAAALPQGSEFAFVLFGAALAAGAMGRADADRATLVVALSMLASPLLFAGAERWIVPRLGDGRRRPDDVITDAPSVPVIICGFGRFGQIVGRTLSARGIEFTALDGDAGNVEVVRRFGHRAFFGDPTRLELLRDVGAGEARILVAALGDPAENLRLVTLARQEFPHLQIFARARNRQHAHLLMEQEVDGIVRETLFSSLHLTEKLLVALGLSRPEAQRTVRVFRDRDEQALREQFRSPKDERHLIQTAAQTAAELRSLFEEDQQAPPLRLVPDAGGEREEPEEPAMSAPARARRARRADGDR